MFPFNSQQKPYATLPPFLNNPLLTLSMLSQNRPIPQLQNPLPNTSLPSQTAMTNFNDMIQNEFLRSYFGRIEKIAEGVISNPTIRNNTADAETFNKYNQFRKNIPFEHGSKSIGFVQAKKSPTLDSKIKIEETHTQQLSEVTHAHPKEMKATRGPYKQREPRAHRDQKSTRTKSFNKAEAMRKETVKEEKVVEPVIEYNHISEEEANVQLNTRYLTKEVYNEESPLIEFTRDFPGWHLDEIFDFMSKAKSYEVIEVINLLSREKEEKLKAAEEKKKVEVEEQTDLNKPRIRTRFWKQNENNRKNEENGSGRSGRKERKLDFLIKLKQLLGVEEINEQKAFAILTKAGQNIKKALEEISENISAYKSDLSREQL